MRPQKILRGVVFTLLLGIAVFPFPAIAGYINFDNITPPGPTPLVLPGATFTPGVSTLFSASAGVSADLLAPTPPNMYQVTLNNLSEEPDNYTVVTITFDKPVSLVSLQMYGNWSSTLWVGLSVTALDNSNNMLDSQVFLSPTKLELNRILLTAEGIKAVVIKVSRGPGHNLEEFISVALDNLCFYPLQPTSAVIPMF